MSSLSGFEGYFGKYATVFLAGNGEFVYRIKEGSKNLLIPKLCAEIVSVVFACSQIVTTLKI